jgi:hypothetical protein
MRAFCDGVSSNSKIMTSGAPLRVTSSRGHPDKLRD